METKVKYPNFHPKILTWKTFSLVIIFAMVSMEPNLQLRQGLVL